MDLLHLLCPSCGAPLGTAPERRVLVCAGCGATAGLLPGEGADTAKRVPRLTLLRRRLLRPRQPVPPQGKVVTLPLWVLPVQRGGLGPWGQRLPPEVRIPALGLERPGLLLRFARSLTRCGPAAEASTPTGWIPEPAEVSMEDAFALAELLALAEVEGWPPDPEVEDAEVPFGPPRLVDLPCHLGPSQLVDLVYGRAISRSLLTSTIPADRRRDLAEVLATG